MALPRRAARLVPRTAFRPEVTALDDSRTLDHCLIPQVVHGNARALHCLFEAFADRLQDGLVRVVLIVTT